MSFFTKACTKCGVSKLESSFYSCRHTSDGLQSQCKLCMKEASKTQYAKREGDFNRLKAAVKAMHEAERAYGCGFYSQEDWWKAYNETARLVGLPERDT